MDVDTLTTIARLRILVACLGETTDPAWWKTSFFSEQSEVFLGPIFPRSQWAARTNAVSECAARIHDAHIGVSQRVFHLFRLPEFAEQAISENLTGGKSSETISKLINTGSAALDKLRIHAGNSPRTKPGPARICDIDSLLTGRAAGAIAAAYVHAAENSYQVFPYFSEAK